jgi:hypothetical protein
MEASMLMVWILYFHLKFVLVRTNSFCNDLDWMLIPASRQAWVTLGVEVAAHEGQYLERARGTRP